MDSSLAVLLTASSSAAVEDDPLSPFASSPKLGRKMFGFVQTRGGNWAEPSFFTPLIVS